MASPFQELQSLPIQLPDHHPKPLYYPPNSNSVIISAVDDQDKAGVYKYGIDTNEIQLLQESEENLICHGQFIDYMNDKLYLFGGDDVFSKFNLNTMKHDQRTHDHPQEIEYCVFHKTASISSSKIYIDNTSIRTSFIWRPWFHRVFFVLGLPILTWVFSQIIRGLLTPSSDALYAVPSRLLTELPLLFLFYGSFYVFLKQLVEFKGRVHIFISLMIVVSLSLITYTEFLQVSDLYGNRMNTVFKTYYQIL